MYEAALREDVTTVLLEGLSRALRKMRPRRPQVTATRITR